MEDIFASLISEKKKVVMTTHLNPDWDGVASLKSMELFLKKSNCPYTIVCEGQLPNNAEDILPNVVYPSTLKEKLDGAVLLILDTDDFLRIPAILNDLSFSKIFFIDHHDQYNHGSDNSIKLIDPKASSTSEIIADYLLTHPDYFDPSSAIWLYIGMYSDTGGFKYTKTSAKTLKIASRLLPSVKDLSLIDEYLFQDKNVADVLFLKKFYGNMKFAFENQLAYTMITLDELNSLSANLQNPSKNLDDVLHVKQVKVAMLVKQLSTELFKIYIRSKPGYEIIDLVHEMGGGGHPCAGGATIKIAFDKVIDYLKILIQNKILEKKV